MEELEYLKDLSIELKGMLNVLDWCNSDQPTERDKFNLLLIVSNKLAEMLGDNGIDYLINEYKQYIDFKLECLEDEIALTDIGTKGIVRNEFGDLF